MSGTQPLRLYLSVDMEGLAGVAHPNQVTFGPGVDRTDYDRSRALMAGETNAAIEGARAAGVDEVVVNDSHWLMRNLRAEDLPAAARLVIGEKPLSMTQELVSRGIRPMPRRPSSAITLAPAMRMASSRTPTRPPRSWRCGSTACRTTRPASTPCA